MLRFMKKIFVVMIAFLIFATNVDYAGMLDPSIPAPYSVYLNSSGYVSWDAPSVDYSGNEMKYKSFQIILLKRHDKHQGELYFHEWKEYGSTRTAPGEDRSYDLTFGSIGYYRVKVRSVNLLGNYSEWTESTEEVETAVEQQIKINTGLAEGIVTTKGGDI